MGLRVIVGWLIETFSGEHPAQQEQPQRFRVSLCVKRRSLSERVVPGLHAAVRGQVCEIHDWNETNPDLPVLPRRGAWEGQR